MKELSIHIQVYPLSSTRRDAYRFEADEFDFSPSVEESDAGCLFNCDKDVTVTTPAADVMADFSIPLPAIVEFSDTEGRKYRVGCPQIPALVSVAPNLNSSTLRIRCGMVRPPLL